MTVGLERLFLLYLLGAEMANDDAQLMYGDRGVDSAVNAPLVRAIRFEFNAAQVPLSSPYSRAKRAASRDPEDLDFGPEDNLCVTSFWGRSG